ncbi:c-type cytochrome [Numidum massiliense]|uniref:c-type cytochrome n=1 Tax=Numidum massiliense TaxID=1522315 RepID=UPI0006D57148|nr:cytochrome c [Numidum massiliense]
MRKKLLTWVFVGLLVLALAACGGKKDDAADGGAKDDSNATAASGEELFKSSNCIACHGDQLNNGSAPALDKIGATLSKDEIVDVIKNGKGGMQAQTQVSDDDAEELAAWLADKK